MNLQMDPLHNTLKTWQCKKVGKCVLHGSRIRSFGVLSTPTEDLHRFWFRLGPGQEVVVHNDLLHYLQFDTITMLELHVTLHTI